eukprot:scaffold401_cov399-Prasinococcus_capsulatus_cf.AAC.20
MQPSYAMTAVPRLSRHAKSPVSRQVYHSALFGSRKQSQPRAISSLGPRHTSYNACTYLRVTTFCRTTAEGLRGTDTDMLAGALLQLVAARAYMLLLPPNCCRGPTVYSVAVPTTQQLTVPPAL